MQHYEFLDNLLALQGRNPDEYSLDVGASPPGSRSCLEGIVLLKSKDNLLPLKDVPDVTVFGWR
jgi:hypothetical protein